MYISVICVLLNCQPQIPLEPEKMEHRVFSNAITTQEVPECWTPYVVTATHLRRERKLAIFLMSNS